MANKKYEIETLELDNMTINEIIQLDNADVYRHVDEPVAWHYPHNYYYGGERIAIEVGLEIQD